MAEQLPYQQFFPGQLLQAAKAVSQIQQFSDRTLLEEV